MSDAGTGPHHALDTLFSAEISTQTSFMADAILTLEHHPSPQLVESLLRAAHAAKGAARVVERGDAERFSHLLEECFLAIHAGRVRPAAEHIDALLAAVDALARIAAPDRGADEVERAALAAAALAHCFGVSQSFAGAADAPPDRRQALHEGATTQPSTLRIDSEKMARLVGLAGELLIELQRFDQPTPTLLRIKRQQFELGVLLDRLPDAMRAGTGDAAIAEAQRRLSACRDQLGNFIGLRARQLRACQDRGRRMYDEVLDARMRPFGDALEGMQRMVRELARSLARQVRLEVRGAETAVDRGILERVKEALVHLLRNAVDHAIEDPAVRQQLGKPAAGAIIVEAAHVSGSLSIVVSDDGAGIDLQALRRAVAERGYATEEMVAGMSDDEVLSFLFLPKFTLKCEVSEISGRGIGLDAVQSIVQGLRGSLEVSTRCGAGTAFRLQLPVSLSVVRCLLVDIGGEPYALAMARVERAILLGREQVLSIEGREYVMLGTEPLGLVDASQVLEVETRDHFPATAGLPVVVLTDRTNRFGFVVDRFLGQHELVVQPLHPLLKKVPDVAAAAVTADGAPALLLDVDDLIRSIDSLLRHGRLRSSRSRRGVAEVRPAKRVLVVDDSFTVREVERKLLEARGYQVEVAVDGMDGWNAVRSCEFDLVITDIDMPRLNGIEFVALIKKDRRLRDVPVMIVSYKDQGEDRERGLEAGANYYFTKGSFHDESLLDAVNDLIGEP